MASVMSVTSPSISLRATARANRRRPSVGARPRRASVRSSNSLTPSVASRVSKLAKLRVAVLDHLKELESHLSQLESPLAKTEDEDPGNQSPSRAVQSQSVSPMSDARARINDGLEMLQRIRSDVCSHLPELPGLDFLPDFSLDEMRSHMPSFELPDIELPNLPSASFSTSLDDLSFNFDRLQFPLSYLPKLTSHLESLHDHISSLQLLSPLSRRFMPSSSNGRMSELLSRLRDPDLFTDPIMGPFGLLGDHKVLPSADVLSTESKIALCQHQVSHGLARSCNGEKLISYEDLPHRHRNNEFVRTGYRFIPLSRWHLLLLSIFQLHNETANVWSHLVPLLLPFVTTVSIQHTESIDLVERIFTFFANICLTSSCVWHVMSGCSHMKAMETAARIDYIGIGWLISATVGSIMYYGFSCRPQTAAIYLLVSLGMALSGTILPFMTFFNERHNKKWRIVFFLSLSFTAIIPLAHLAAVHSPQDMYNFMRPELPSLGAYIVGLILYAFHLPEYLVPHRWVRYTDWFGGGSHAIWHLFIVLAIKLHKEAMVEHRKGIGGEVCQLGWGESIILHR